MIVYWSTLKAMYTCNTISDYNIFWKKTNFKLKRKGKNNLDLYIVSEYIN